jgi:hypothetical protein
VRFFLLVVETEQKANPAEADAGARIFYEKYRDALI